MGIGQGFTAEDDEDDVVEGVVMMLLYSLLYS